MVVFIIVLLGTLQKEANFKSVLSVGMACYVWNCGSLMHNTVVEVILRPVTMPSAGARVGGDDFWVGFIFQMGKLT